MSYDIYLITRRCPTCGHSGQTFSNLPDPTYNLTEIFHLALQGEPMPNPGTSEMEVVILGKKTDSPRGLRLLDGVKAKHSIPFLEKAVERMEDPAWKDRFIALEPLNKWGDFPGATKVMKQLLEAAKECGEEFEWEVR
jgi:hypothetical protein